MRIIPITVAILFASVPPLYPQIVADGSTNILSNVTNNIIGDVTVGTNGSFTSLVLSNNVLLTNSLSGFIGRNTTARSNQVILLSPGARWFMGGDLINGNSGSFNRLTITNGASVKSTQGWIGLNSSSSNNVVVITDPGSSWTNIAELRMGYGGSGNQFLLSNGAFVNSANGFIGSDSGANSNSASISGPGSQWRALNYYVGNNGSSNQLLVSDGGQVANSNGYVGFTGRGNTAWITGTNSLWSNTSNLVVGVNGSDNQLVVTNQAKVSVGTFGVIGSNSGANSNSVTVTDAGTSWLVTSDIHVGSNGAANQLVISNSARISDLNGVIGFGATGSNNVAQVTGLGSMWSNRINLVIGNTGPGNQLVVSNGGSVFSLNGRLGSNAPSAQFNTALVTGLGLIWSNENVLSVGVLATGNQLVVSNQGTVFAGKAVNLGETTNSSSNRIVVDGGTLRATNEIGTAILDLRRGTAVFNAGIMDVDQLVLTNGTQGKFEFNAGTLTTRGATIVGSFYLGESALAEPAIWDVRAGVSQHLLLGGFDLVIGRNSSFNQLLVTNGALLTCDNEAIIGLNAGANSNTALLSGTGSLWSLAGGLYVGFDGDANQLVISNGARVTGLNGIIGYNAGNNNTVLVTGPGSAWNNSGFGGRRHHERGKPLAHRRQRDRPGRGQLVSGYWCRCRE